MLKLNVLVMFGSKSVEHEISIISAMQVIKKMDKRKYNAIPLYISKDMQMYTGEQYGKIETFKKLPSDLKDKVRIQVIDNRGYCVFNSKFKKKIPFDIVLPVLHGTNGEDGTIQGFLKTLQIPYALSGFGACVLMQDKCYMKDILKVHDIPSLPYVKIYDYERKNISNIYDKVSRIDYPCIIKPARLGSSIGIQIVKSENDLIHALDECFIYDEKVLVEPYLEDIREYNISVMGNMENSQLSMIEEVFKSEQILSFNDKYETDKKSSLEIKRNLLVNLEEEEKRQLEEIGRLCFEIFECNGIIRIDFIYHVKEKSFYVNEINAIPGSLSYYLWEGKFKNLTEMIDEIINLGIMRNEKDKDKICSYDTNILLNFNENKKFKK